MILLEYSRFLVRFMEKWTKREKSGQLRGSFVAAKRPLAAAKVLATVKVLAAAKDPHTVARPRGKVGSALGSPR